MQCGAKQEEPVLLGAGLRLRRKDSEVGLCPATEKREEPVGHASVLTTTPQLASHLEFQQRHAGAGLD